MLLAAFGLLLACWAPAYVGSRDNERPRFRNGPPPGGRPFNGPRWAR